MTDPPNPEIALAIDAGALRTNYHDSADGAPVMLIHGSGPGVTAWANWRLTMLALATQSASLSSLIARSCMFSGAAANGRNSNTRRDLIGC